MAKPPGPPKKRGRPKKRPNPQKPRAVQQQPENPPTQPQAGRGAEATGPTQVSGGGGKIDLADVLAPQPPQAPAPPPPPGPRLRADQLAGGVRVAVGFVCKLAGLNVVLDEDEAETLAESMIPMIEKYLPSIGGDYAAEINFAIVSSVIIGGAASRAKRNRGGAGAEGNREDQQR